MLASIPFSIPDEPLYLIYDINRVIQRRAGGLEANMKNWSSLPQQKDSNGISKEVRKKIQADCHDAIALQLLLKLKRQLKIVYGLDDSRCQAFSLKEHPKPGETLSRQSIPFNLSDIPTSLPNSFQDMLQSYQVSSRQKETSSTSGMRNSVETSPLLHHIAKNNQHCGEMEPL